MNNNKIIIGILAGMGPKSTSPFLDLIIEQCQKQYGARNDIDFPHIMIYSLPTPFYVNQKIDDEKMELIISQGLQKLENTGVDFISMPCNTAHKYFENLKNCIKIPLLNIVEVTLNKLNKISKNVTIFGTETTINSNVYQKIINKQKNVRLIYDEEWQKEINQLIQGIKNGDSEQQLLPIIERLSNYLKRKKIDTIIIACTDITKIVKTMRDFKVIDSSEALAEETVKRFLSHQK